MKIDLTEKEADLILGLRNFRNSKHNPSKAMEMELDELYETLKL